MNREILFRGKRVSNSNWIEGYFVLLAINEGLKHAIHTGTDEGRFILFEVIPDTVGQFTGLCDKNGNKIFEGDILKATYTEQRQYQGVSYQDEHSCVEEVIYNEKSACFMLKIMCEDVPLYRPLHNFGSLANIKELEVIGNIYDNPELLEEKL